MTGAEAAGIADGETVDALLGGRVRLIQPREGYRAATDPVLLAAACAALPGESALDLGCGAGAAALCLAARVPGVATTGLEIQPAYAALARRNAALNSCAFEVIEGDVAAPPAALRSRVFDHVIANPPFFAAADQPSPVSGRDVARRAADVGDAGLWVDAGLRRLKQGGWLTMINRVERLPEMLAALDGRAGAVAVLPLAARAGRPAKRVILRARKDRGGPFRLLAPFVLHDGAAHGGDADDFTEAARAVLRDGAALEV
jgi:tRNA1Val (adenine37-N6)-methyltransferase